MTDLEGGLIGSVESAGLIGYVNLYNADDFGGVYLYVVLAGS